MTATRLATPLALAFWLWASTMVAVAWFAREMCDSARCGGDEDSMLRLSIGSWLAASVVVAGIQFRWRPALPAVAVLIQAGLAWAAVSVTRLDPFGVRVAPPFIWIGLAAEGVAALAILLSWRSRQTRVAPTR